MLQQLGQSIPSDLALAVALALITAAAIADCRTRRIPNAIPLLLVGLFLLHAFVTGNPSAVMELAAGVAMLIVGFGLYIGRLFGAGDAKLLAAITPYLGLAAIPLFLVLTMLAGGAIAFALLIRHRLGSGGARPAPLVPYALAIALGATGTVAEALLAS